MPPPGLPTAVRTGSLADFVTHLPLRLCIASSILSFGPGAIYATCPSSLPYPFHFYYFCTYTCTVYRSAYVSFPPLRTLSTPQSTYLIVFATLGRPIPPVRHPAIPCSASPRIVDLSSASVPPQSVGYLCSPLSPYVLLMIIFAALPLLFRPTAPPFPPAGDFRIPSACSAES